MQTYDIRINDYQRKLLERAMNALIDVEGTALAKEDGDREEPGLCGGEENKLEEANLLLEMIAQLPEHYELGLVNSFCE